MQADGHGLFASRVRNMSREVRYCTTEDSENRVV